MHYTFGTCRRIPRDLQTSRLAGTCCQQGSRHKPGHRGIEAYSCIRCWLLLAGFLGKLFIFLFVFAMLERARAIRAFLRPTLVLGSPRLVEVAGLAALPGAIRALG